MTDLLDARAVLANEADPIIRLDCAWKSFDTLEALTDVSVAVQKGEIVYIIDPLGAANATLLGCINDLERNRRRAIHSEGKPVDRRMRGGGRAWSPTRTSGSRQSGRRWG
jgi:ABC-type polar amino acid transport system ATPase subunit